VEESKDKQSNDSMLGGAESDGRSTTYTTNAMSSIEKMDEGDQKKKDIIFPSATT